MSLNNKNKYYVYCHTNKINNKKYIGITSQKPKQRWGVNGSKYKENTYFTRAINKYGWDNFDHKILFEKLTKEEACVIEMQLIKQYKSNTRKYGYNLSSGGEMGYTGVFNNARSKKVYQYDLDGKFIKEWQSRAEVERKLEIYATSIGACCRGKKQTAGGFQWRNEYYKKISALAPLSERKAKNHARSIVQYDLNGKFIKQFDSILGASNLLNIDRGSIQACCQGRYARAGNYIWKYAEDKCA